MTKFNSRRFFARRRPAVILVVLICVMTIALTLFGLWARQIINEKRRIDTQAYQDQAVRLAEAGIQRILATRASNSAAGSETWSVPADQLDGRHTAVVRLRVTPGADGKSTTYIATAEYPAESLLRKVVTRSIPVSGPKSTEAP